VGARIHYHIVFCLQQHPGVPNHSVTIVGNSMKYQYPGTVGFCGVYFPAAQHRAVRRSYVEIFAVRANLRKSYVRVTRHVVCERSLFRMQKAGGAIPADDSRKQCGKEHQNQGNAYQAGHAIDTRRLRPMFLKKKAR
jgi:hypothetical protein